MRTLKRIRYHSMNSWNLCTAPAYNLKVYNVVDRELQDKVFELMESEDFYDPINDLVEDFGVSHNYEWQAGFNGRSGGYLVLYRGGRRPSGYRSYCQQCGQRNYQAVPDGTTGQCGRCNAVARVNYQTPPTEHFTYPGKGIEDSEVPGKVLRDFRKLAVSIVKCAEDMARHCTVEEEKYTVVKSRKVIV